MGGLLSAGKRSPIPLDKPSAAETPLPPIVRFKMLLLQTWYNHSDDGVEEQVNDTRSLMRFCGLQREDQVPDHSVLCRFRKALNKAAAGEVLLNTINEQLT